MGRSAIPTYTTGDLITAAHGNTYWRDNEAYYYNLLDGNIDTANLKDDAVAFAKMAEREGVLITRKTAVNSNTTLSYITFTAEGFDSDAMWAVGDPTKLYFPTAGVYQVSALVRWDVRAAESYRVAAVYRNGSTSEDNYVCGQSITAPGTAPAICCVSMTFEFAADDYIRLGVQSGETQGINIAMMSAYRLNIK